MQTANFQLLLIVLILMNCRNGHLQQRFVLFCLEKTSKDKKIIILLWLVVLFVCFILFNQRLHVVINVFDYLACVNLTFAAYSSCSCDASFFQWSKSVVYTISRRVKTWLMLLISCCIIFSFDLAWHIYIERTDRRQTNWYAMICRLSTSV